jgi:hypothetical protein
MADDYEVGFGRPPKATRFKRGESGNPRGRPRRKPNFKDDFNAELREPLVVHENGRERRLTKQRALIKSLMSLAIKGNVRAMNAVLAATRSLDLGQEDQSDNAIDPVELDLLEAFVARERRRMPSAGEKSQPSRGASRKARKGDRKHKA